VLTATYSAEEEARMLRRVVLVLVTLTATLVAGASIGDAAGPHWVRYHQADIRYPAGAVCRFPVYEHVTRDREFVKVVSRYANGKPRLELFRGPLFVKVTNTDTGRSIRRDLSGRAIEILARNGAFESLTIQRGHFGAGLPKGSQPHRGLYRVSGRWSSVSVNPDGTLSLVLGRPHGRARNLCPLLAGTPRS
jgi:hypothetical protein